MCSRCSSSSRIVIVNTPYIQLCSRLFARRLLGLMNAPATVPERRGTPDPAFPLRCCRPNSGPPPICARPLYGNLLSSARGAGRISAKAVRTTENPPERRISRGFQRIRPRRRGPLLYKSSTGKGSRLSAPLLWGKWMGRKSLLSFLWIHGMINPQSNHSLSREAEGTGPMKPGNLRRRAARCQFLRPSAGG